MKYFEVFKAGNYPQGKFTKEGFQYLIIDGIKANAVRICKNINVVELDTLIADIVFTEIPS